jgi:hypothetical protein
VTTYVTDALASAWLSLIVDTPAFASLHFEAPSTDNPMASEVNGATYARVPVVWRQVGARTLVNNQAMQWLNLEQTSIGAVGLFTDPFAGALLLYSSLASPVPVPDRGSYEIAAEELVITF